MARLEPTGAAGCTRRGVGVPHRRHVLWPGSVDPRATPARPVGCHGSRADVVGQRLRVTHDARATDTSAIAEAVAEAGMRAWIEPTSRATAPRRPIGRVAAGCWASRPVPPRRRTVPRRGGVLAARGAAGLAIGSSRSPSLAGGIAPARRALASLVPHARHARADGRRRHRRRRARRLGRSGHRRRSCSRLAQCARGAQHGSRAPRRSARSSTLAPRRGAACGATIDEQRMPLDDVRRRRRRDRAARRDGSRSTAWCVRARATSIRRR